MKKRPHSIDCSAAIEPSMTQQSFMNECDINNIMAKYERTGQINFTRDVSSGRYIDLASVDDYHSAMNKVAAAQQAFDALPSKIRAAFKNDPAEFLAFTVDPKNTDKAVELGIATARPVPSPDPVKSLTDQISALAEQVSGLSRSPDSVRAKRAPSAPAEGARPEAS